MRVKSIITFSIISSFFLFSLISIWKILSTLQGIELKTLNFNFYFLSGIIISFASIFLSEKLNKLSLVILLSSVFVPPCTCVNQYLPTSCESLFIFQLCVSPSIYFVHCNWPRFLWTRRAIEYVRKLIKSIYDGK